MKGGKERGERVGRSGVWCVLRDAADLITLGDLTSIVVRDPDTCFAVSGIHGILRSKMEPTSTVQCAQSVYYIEYRLQYVWLRHAKLA